MKIIKCYENYKELKKSLKSRIYNLTNDSIGQYNNGDYSVDITLRDYDENWCIDYDVYKKNEELMLKLNEFLNRGYEGLMREPFYGKNSRYNQHFNENVMLIEIGGPESTISEVSLSVKAFAESLSNLLGEDYGR